MIMDVKNHKFNYVSLNVTVQLLDCSREYLYSLVRKGILKIYHLDPNQDKNQRRKGKGYFKLNEIEDAFIEKKIDEIL